MSRHSLIPLLLCSLIAAASLYTYRQAPDNNFLFDDRPNITANEAVHMQELSVSALWRAITDGRLPSRPLANLSFAIDWWRGGGDASSFIHTNMLIHAVNGILVFWVLVMLLSFHNAERIGQIWLCAVVATLLWSLHPIQVQAVSYIVQRMTTLAALFSLLSVAAYLHARRTTAGTGRSFWFTVTGVSLLLAVSAKENAWITPCLLILIEVSVIRQGSPLFNHRGEKFFAWTVLVMMILGASSLLLQVGPLWEWLSPAYRYREFSMAERVLTQPRVILFHLEQMVWPLSERFSLLHDIRPSISLFESVNTLISWMVLTVWCGLGLWLLLTRRRLLAACFFIWLPLTLVIESSVVGLELVFEHRMYLPSVSLAGLLAIGLLWMFRHSNRMGFAVLIPVALLSLALSVITTSIIPRWQDEWRVYEHATHLYPNYARAHNLYGNALIDSKDYAMAERAFRRVLQLEPGYPDVWKFLGRTLAEQGRLDEAQQAFTEAQSRTPADADIWNNLGALALQRGQVAEASRYLNQALQIDPDHRPARQNLDVLQGLNRR